MLVMVKQLVGENSKRLKNLEYQEWGPTDDENKDNNKKHGNNLIMKLLLKGLCSLPLAIEPYSYLQLWIFLHSQGLPFYKGKEIQTLQQKFGMRAS